MLLTLHLKNEIEQDMVPITQVNLSTDPIQLTKHTPSWIPLIVYRIS